MFFPSKIRVTKPNTLEKQKEIFLKVLVVKKRFCSTSVVQRNCLRLRNE